MLSDKQIERTIGKFINLQNILEEKMFVARASVTMEMQKTFEKLHEPPNSGYKPVAENRRWGEERQYCWFRGKYVVPSRLTGERLFLRVHVGFAEALLFVDNVPCGSYAKQLSSTGTCSHNICMISNSAVAKKRIEIAIEAYAGHNFAGTQPFIEEPKLEFDYDIDGFLICTKDELIYDTYFNVRMLNEMIASTQDSFRKAELINCMIEAHETIYYAFNYADENLYRNRLAQVNELIKKSLAMPNFESSPSVAIMGHSHMDTAWLWEIDETIKKCAGTFSNAISLMAQYPEYMFIQSSACHGNWMRQHYPQLFEKIKKAVAMNRYEPNGGAWVECDCNIISGEFMIRQFLWGQSFTREHFEYTSNVFWLPDTFGYSSAIPQIMKGCKIDYFMTAKIDWNDTNVFPYDTFYWKGIDDTAVLSHFNRIHMYPSPIDINKTIYGTNEQRGIAQKGVTGTRFLAFGHRDGGGGPGFDMLELANRSRNTKGVPRTEYSAAGEFMKKLEQKIVNPNTYKGELYFEMHRGTLTSTALLKRQNRKAEFSIRDAEFCIVRKAIGEGKPASDDSIKEYVETTLTNQSHDILSGTSITEVNERSYREMAEVIKKTSEIAKNAIPTTPEEDKVTVINTLSFPRHSVKLPYRSGKTIDLEKVQVTEEIDGKKWLIAANTCIPAMGSKTFRYVDGYIEYPSAFMYGDNKLETPYALIAFDEKGFISSFIDKRNNRQIKGEGYNLNTFLMAEDTPRQWENWDIDADYEMKLVDCAGLISRKIISNGAVEFRIRSQYAISKYSSIIQDMVFYADSARVDFETRIVWKDKHRLLKTAFDTNIQANFVRQEIQFGYVERPTTRNNSIEAAKYEALNHKYSDLSELNFGVSLLNDCKYGISVYEGSMRLTLMKGGTKPDPTADAGVHYMTYSLLPHEGGFSAQNVIQPAYILNCPPVVVPGAADMPLFLKITASNIILETVKPCHNATTAFIARFYECEGNRTRTCIRFNFSIRKIEETNMLEEPFRELCTDELSDIEFRPFEIKTFKIYY